MSPLHLHPPPLHPYRLFHLSARLRLRNPSFSSSSSSSSQQPPSPPKDDYYALLLSDPIPSPAAESTLKPPSYAAPPNSSSSSSSAPTAAAPSIQGSAKGPDNNPVLFSTPLAGPSARMRGLSRGEKGLERPPEPDNCCMSGCVNCVWDAYREEVEEWAAARRERERRLMGMGGGDGDEGQVGDLDGVAGLGLDGVEEGEGGDLFEGVPVGIREFMNTEKRLRERRLAERAG